MNDVVQLTTTQLQWMTDHVELHLDSRFWDAPFWRVPVSLPSFDFIQVFDGEERDKTNVEGMRSSFRYDPVADLLQVIQTTIPDDNRDLTLVFQRTVINGKIYWEMVSMNGNPVIQESIDDATMWGFILAGVRVFWMIQWFMVNSPMNYFECEEKVAKRTNVKKKSKHSKGKSKVYLYKSYTLIRDWKQKIKLNSKHQIVCPCWTVRGHYRHYKSGKVVFVQSYEKGKKRNESLPKEYVILPKMDKEGIENVGCL